MATLPAVIEILAAAKTLHIQCISEIPIPFLAVKKDGTPNKKFGLSYRRYTYDGKVFICEKEGFLKALEDGQLFEVKLEKEDDQLSLLSYVTWQQFNGQKLNQVKSDAITADNYLAKKLDPADTLALE
jgi:hypothetical protein